MTGKMQTGILDSGLHAFTTLLNSSVGESDNGYTGETIGVIHFDFDDDAFESDNRTGKNSGKHGKSVDEEG